MTTKLRSRLSLRGITLTIYWLAMFIGTHVPRVPPIHGLEPSDKVLHFLAFTGLAVLMATAWMTKTVLINWRHYCIMFIIAAIYAALDELLQTPVGRDCSLFDWYADVAGTIFGLIVYAAIMEIVNRRKIARDEHPSARST